VGLRVVARPGCRRLAAASGPFVMFTLIQTARLNDVDPQDWLADVLGRLNDHNIHNLDQLLPWNWKVQAARLAA
jgi:transposase